MFLTLGTKDPSHQLAKFMHQMHISSLELTRSTCLLGQANPNPVVQTNQPCDGQLTTKLGFTPGHTNMIIIAFFLLMDPTSSDTTSITLLTSNFSFTIVAWTFKQPLMPNYCWHSWPHSNRFFQKMRSKTKSSSLAAVSFVFNFYVLHFRQHHAPSLPIPSLPLNLRALLLPSSLHISVGMALALTFHLRTLQMLTLCGWSHGPLDRQY